MRLQNLWFFIQQSFNDLCHGTFSYFVCTYFYLPRWIKVILFPLPAQNKMSRDIKILIPPQGKKPSVFALKCRCINRLFFILFSFLLLGVKRPSFHACWSFFSLLGVKRNDYLFFGGIYSNMQSMYRLRGFLPIFGGISLIRPSDRKPTFLTPRFCFALEIIIFLGFFRFILRRKSRLRINLKNPRKII